MLRGLAWNAAFALAVFAASAAPGGAAVADGAPFSSPLEFRSVPEKQILILDPSVVDDPRASGFGPWSLARRLKDLADASDSPDSWLAAWIGTWSDTRELGAFPVAPRPSGRFRALWRSAGGREEPRAETAPGRLLAIAYRPDLRAPESPAGELRLVYGWIRRSTGEPVELTTIFEYALPEEGFLEADRTRRTSWPRAFAALGSLPFGSAYNETIRRMIEQGAQPEALLRVRTNDFYLDFVWELREFRRDARGFLRQVLLDDVPDLSLNGPRAAELVRWALENASGLATGTARLPEAWRTGAAVVPGDSFRWLAGRGLPEATRRALSVRTCNGCHSGETGSRFTHVFPRTRGFQSEISPFLREAALERADVLRELLAAEARRP